MSSSFRELIEKDVRHPVLVPSLRVEASLPEQPGEGFFGYSSSIFSSCKELVQQVVYAFVLFVFLRLEAHPHPPPEEPEEGSLESLSSFLLLHILLLQGASLPKEPGEESPASLPFSSSFSYMSSSCRELVRQVVRHSVLPASLRVEASLPWGSNSCVPSFLLFLLFLFLLLFPLLLGPGAPSYLHLCLSFSQRKEAPLPSPAKSLEKNLLGPILLLLLFLFLFLFFLPSILLSQGTSTAGCLHLCPSSLPLTGSRSPLNEDPGEEPFVSLPSFLSPPPPPPPSSPLARS